MKILRAFEYFGLRASNVTVAVGWPSSSGRAAWNGPNTAFLSKRWFVEIQITYWSAPVDFCHVTASSARFTCWLGVGSTMSGGEIAVTHGVLRDSGEISSAPVWFGPPAPEPEPAVPPPPVPP